MVDFSLIKDRYSLRPKLWKAIYFLMNTDYLIKLLKQRNLLDAVPMIHAYEYVSSLFIDSGLLDENEKKVFNNLLSPLAKHLENLYRERSVEYNLKTSIDYLQDLYFRAKEKTNLKDDLGYNVREDPEEVFKYFIALYKTS